LSENKYQCVIVRITGDLFVLDSVYLLLAEGVVSVGKKWHKRRKFDAGANV